VNSGNFCVCEVMRRECVSVRVGVGVGMQCVSLYLRLCLRLRSCMSECVHFSVREKLFSCPCVSHGVCP